MDPEDKTIDSVVGIMPIPRDIRISAVATIRPKHQITLDVNMLDFYNAEAGDLVVYELTAIKKKKKV